MFYTLNNGKLSLESNKLFTHIKNSNPYLKTECERLELSRTTLQATQHEEQQALENLSNEIRRGRDSNPRYSFWPYNILAGCRLQPTRPPLLILFSTSETEKELVHSENQEPQKIKYNTIKMWLER